MNVRARSRGLVLLCAVVFALVAGVAMLATPPAEAARCCWVMVIPLTSADLEEPWPDRGAGFEFASRPAADGDSPFGHP